MGKEEKIVQEMTRLGTYDPAFDPSIKDLCTLERERSRMRKEWKTTADPGKPPSFTHPLYAEIKSLGKEINKLRSDLGLVPVGLTRLRSRAVPQGETAPPPASGNAAFGELLNTLRGKANGQP